MEILLKGSESGLGVPSVMRLPMAMIDSFWVDLVGLFLVQEINIYSW